MADLNTPNLNLILPEVGASDDTWGDKLNANFSLLDGVILNRTTGGTIQGPLTVVGNLTGGANAASVHSLTGALSVTENVTLGTNTANSHQIRGSITTTAGATVQGNAVMGTNTTNTHTANGSLTVTNGLSVTAGGISGSGASITNLNANNIATGTIANARTTGSSTNVGNSLVLRDASGNFTASTVTAALNGNASTATTLQTARTINGVSFNGSANITITAANPQNLSAGVGLTGGPYNGSAAVTIAMGTPGTISNSSSNTATGTTHVHAISGRFVENTSGSAAFYGARAWVNFNGSNLTTRAGVNVTSVASNGTGGFTVNFATAFIDANYAVCGNASPAYGTNRNIAVGTNTSGDAARTANTTTQCFINVATPLNVGHPAEFVTLAFFR